MAEADRLTFEGEAVLALEGDTVLDALLRHGAKVASGCRAGACQSCVMRCVDGDVPDGARVGLSRRQKESGLFLACQCPAAAVRDVRSAADAFPFVPATLVDRRMASADVLILRVVPESHFSVPLGCFVKLTLAGVTRSYSVASDAEGLHVHVRLIDGGAMSERLRHAPIGTPLTITGPYGDCAYDETYHGKPILAVCSGTGLAPIVGVVTDALRHGHSAPIHIFHGAASPAGLYFGDELDRLARDHANVKVARCVDVDAAAGLHMGSPLEVALAHYPDLDGWKVLTCGHPALVKKTQRMTFLAGASLKDVHADSFADQSSGT